MSYSLPDGTGRLLLAMGVLASLAVALAFRILWVGPQRDLLAMRRLELEQSRSEAVGARRAADRLPALEKEVGRLRRRREVLVRGLTGPDDGAVLLRGLQEIATGAGLKLEAFTPAAVRQRGGFEEWPVRLELSGGFQDLIVFLDVVGRLPRIVIIDRMSIRALAPETRPGTIAVTCTATTYALHESVQAEEGAAGMRPRPSR